MPLPWKIAARELRGGLKGFRIFLACLTLGVAAIASVGSVSSALMRGLAEEGQSILGGDVGFELVHRETDAAERAWLDQVVARGGELSKTADMRAMGRAVKNDSRTLVELKAVDKAYPLYGEVALASGAPLDRALAQDSSGRFGAVVEPVLLERLGLEAGDALKVGTQTFEIRSAIDNEPDRVAGGFAIGPRVMISEEALATTGLVTIGSLVDYEYRLKLPPGEQSNEAVAQFVTDTKEALPESGWRIRDRSNSAPGLRRTVGQVALFLTLVGLTALIVGGVGVGNAIKSYIDKKREVIATFKCLGAPGGLIFQIYFLQVMAIALVGVAFGLAIGAVVPVIAQATLADLLPVPTVFSIYPGALILAAIYGVVTAVAFAVWPLARARDIPAAGLFRDIVAPSRKWPRPFYVALTAGALGVLAVLAVALTEDYQRLFAVWFLVGTAASFGVLLLAADLMMWVAKKAGRPKQPSLRIALANLYRPGAPTSSVVLSLGLGLTLLVTISLIDGNITRQVATQLPDRAPSFFFVDMQKAQLEPFNAILDDTDGIVSVNQVPMIRGPIVAVNGVRAGDVEATPDTRWALRGDRGFTYSAALPQGSELVRGEWWPEDYQGPPLVSFSRELAEGWNVGIGDTLTIDVLGREITAEIASLRDITWQSGGINFILVFSPGVLDNAPQTVLSTVTMEEAGELELQRRVTDAFPNVTSIRVKEAISSVSSLLEDLVLAVRATSVVTIVAGILVLAGAMAAGHRHRVYDSVVLKVLGATRARVLGAYALEYALLGFGTALIAAGAGTLAAYLVITQVMQAEWLFLPGTLAVTVVGATVITMGFGLVGTWSALSRKAAPILRSE
ncbi:FtsX-like permease family protein [Pyruvatibacter mobilis]|uniref:FtsX-like permease family protein n=2 Tax=Pyruvatibacter mobilis TaxID=1712261 RepID=A0A845Q829_9HYPH|nr:FtsX-like permease family protein [Pyruvatibacter mobilis]NBG94201.1 FtsX-like permease family protein [Pyruvatibacter mobilis]QJD76951.1 FtsX-like permease family protein [Pyruvatibacter mobilis]